jgi:hypothetical protein
MDQGMRQIKTAGACRGVDGAWGVAETCVPFCRQAGWQEGATNVIIS